MTSSKQAQHYLITNKWDLDSAAVEYYTAQEEAQTVTSRPPERQHVMAYEGSGSDDDEFRPENPGDYVSEREPFGGGSQGRRLGDEGDPTPAISHPSRPEKSKSSGKEKAPQKKFATLGDFGSSSQNHGSEDDDDDEKQDLFAGGEKSGLAVQNPDDIKKKILERARK